jgi:hypothetical protein
MSYKKIPIIIIFTLIVSSLQTVVWPTFAGNIPSPMFWLAIFAYNSIYLKIPRALILNYFLVIILSVFTSATIGMLLSLTLVITVSLGYFKSRIFWPGLKYYLMSVTAVCVLFHVASYLFSQIVDQNPVGFIPFERSLQIILTPLAAAPIYWMMEWLDRFDDKSDEVIHRQQAEEL